MGIFGDSHQMSSTYPSRAFAGGYTLNVNVFSPRYESNGLDNLSFLFYYSL